MSRPPMPASGMVTIWADGEPAVTALLMGDPDAEIGGPVWEDLEREGLEPMSRYKGRTLDNMSLALRLQFGVTTKGRRVEDDLANLVGLSRPEKDTITPGGVWVMGEVPFKTTDLLRIDGAIKLGKRRYFESADDTRTLKYQEITVAFTELEAGSYTSSTPTKTRDARGKRRVRVIRTRSGDTVRKVAISELGNAGRWTELRGWNPKLAKTDPDAPLRPGTKITIK